MDPAYGLVPELTSNTSNDKLDSNSNNSKIDLKKSEKFYYSPWRFFDYFYNNNDNNETKNKKRKS